MTNAGSFTLNGKAVLVTGGTGSFGQAFVRLLVEHFEPARILVYSRDELKQFEMDRNLDYPNLEFMIGDVRDAERIQRAIRGIDVVVHAAALKQVPTAEQNPIETIKTNILGAENVVNACLDSKVTNVIVLSTDKAVNPVNLYGATKLCSDKLFVAANMLAGPEGTKFSVVRYGNVIGSRGSVIPFFKEQARTGKLPITDERMTRFWITLDQGVNFVAHCLDLMKGGEIFIPKLPSMKMVDLARAMGPDCEIEIIGIRPGEKLDEVMVPRDEARNTLEFDNYFIIQPDFLRKTNTDISYGREKPRRVPEEFEYRSDTNEQWMTVEDFRHIVG